MTPTAALHRRRWAESELQSLAQLATGGSCVDARPTPVGMAAASAHQQQLWLPSHGKDSKTSLPRPIGVMRRGRECGSQQPASHVTSSSPHVVHAAHANGAYQQAVATPVVALGAAHKDRGHRRRHDHFTIFVSIGARSGGIRSCGWFSRGDEPRATCSRSASYRRQLHRR